MNRNRIEKLIVAGRRVSKLRKELAEAEAEFDQILQSDFALTETVTLLTRLVDYLNHVNGPVHLPTILDAFQQEKISSVRSGLSRLVYEKKIRRLGRALYVCKM